MSQKHFLNQFLRKGNKVGAVAPSSRFLSDKMLSSLPIEQCKLIVELGPGTGVFTERIIERKNPDCTFIMIELNDSFYSSLVEKYQKEGIEILHDSASNLQEILSKRSLSQCDLIISSIPLAILNKELQNSIIKTASDCLAPDGAFVQFQYSLQAKKVLSQYFSKIGIGFTALNFPPAFVYTCKN
ncbi:MAG: hypothetical protein RIQ90_175 [Bacteroidota bacterium]|jgi:phospholipid N-methyltransferase